MWKTITLSQFLELREVENTSYNSNIEKLIDIISIAKDLDPDEVEDWSLSKIDEVYDSLSWLYSEPPKNFKREINGLYFKELNDLTLAEYIELVHLFEDNYIENLPTICGVLYRVVNRFSSEWGHTKVEPYEYNAIERGEEFLERPITDVYGIIKEFLDFQNTFEETYSPLFEPEFDPDEDIEPDEEDKLEEEKKKFSWEHFIYNLCNGDLTKSDAVLNLGLIYTFNMLAMRNTFES